MVDFDEYVSSLCDSQDPGDVTDLPTESDYVESPAASLSSEGRPDPADGEKDAEDYDERAGKPEFGEHSFC